MLFMSMLLGHKTYSCITQGKTCINAVAKCFVYTGRAIFIQLFLSVQRRAYKNIATYIATVYS